MDNNGPPDSSSDVRTSIDGSFRDNITSSDCQIISQSLDAEHEMKEYDAEVNRPRTAIHLLENKSELKKSTVRCRSSSSLVHRLPTEILTKIFSIACENDLLWKDIYPDVTRLYRVCGRWWEVIRSAPKLWSSMNIRFRRWEKSFPALEKVVRLFLDRSDTQPLNLELDFYSKYPGQCPEQDILPIIHALHEHAARWQVLSIDYPPSTFALPPGHLGLPALQQLKIDGVQPNILSSLFMNSACLRSLNVTRAYAKTLPSDIRFHQIKTLTIRSTLAAPAIEYFARFPALETLYMYKIYSFDSWDDLEHHSSNTLTSMTCQFDDQHALDTTMRCLTLPSLTSLQVEGTATSFAPFEMKDRWSTWEGGAVADFLSRSSCSITSLCLNYLPITDIETISLLEFLPTLVSLEIGERPRCPRFPEDCEGGPLPNRIITQPFLQRLAVQREPFRSPSHRFLPLLTDITITMRIGDDAVAQGLANAVASRWIPAPEEAKEIGVKSLKSLTMTLVEREDNSEERRWLQPLKCFRDAGLRLRVDFCTRRTYAAPSTRYSSASLLNLQIWDTSHYLNGELLRPVQRVPGANVRDYAQVATYDP
ncbi:hypothetical protein PQX77_019765 [Marasmius sp. AFHP31]|nr:hypothetical protein PQX77_019765 [Marasmius sp. AFHP31]